MQPSKTPQTKNVYHRPHLTVYGKVRDLTQGTQSMRQSDGAQNNPLNKYS
jgi:hypothetical protein